MTVLVCPECNGESFKIWQKTNSSLWFTECLTCKAHYFIEGAIQFIPQRKPEPIRDGAM